MLPRLEGSEKQIKWARSIREQMLMAWGTAEPELFKTVEHDLIQTTLAAWWITHRQKDLGTVVPYIVKVKANVTHREAKTVTSSLPPQSFNNDEVYRFVGRLRSVVTGELAEDPDCPF